MTEPHLFGASSGVYVRIVRLALAEKGVAYQLVDDVSLVSRNERILGDLYDTDLRLRVDSVRVLGPDKSEMRIDGVHYLVDTRLDEDFVDVSGKFGSGQRL